MPAQLARGFAEAHGLRVDSEPAISQTLFLRVAEPLAPLVPIPVPIACRVVHRSRRPMTALAAEVAGRDERRP